ncbi:MAG: hypothetical protein KDG50_10640 [Chromatiales bacterium]|nr:hypothetical protein [Chromatiales bacterium]
MTKATSVSSLGASLLLALVAVTPARAAEVREYDVEIIIFAHVAGLLAGEERTMVEPAGFQGLPQTIEPLPLPTTIAAPQYPQMLPGQLTLGAAASAISANGAYRLLRHFGWRQDAQTSSPVPVIDVQPLRFGLQTYRLDGQIRVERKRFLHVNTELSLSGSSLDPNAGTERFEMNAHRRMRSSETHYLDHPVLGIIVRVTPVSEGENA